MKSSQIKQVIPAMLPYPHKSKILQSTYSRNTTTFLHMMKKNPPSRGPTAYTLLQKKKQKPIIIPRRETFYQEEPSSISLLNLFNQDQKNMY
jgi:hypothetical protein